MGAHLFIVLTEPDSMSGRVVVVPIVTERAHTDKTVRLDHGDHPFIKHPSNVDFGAARYAFVAKLAEAIARGEASLDDDVAETLLMRMQRGLLESSHTINEIAAYVRSVLPEIA
jgi:hypothetical protein